MVQLELVRVRVQLDRRDLGGALVVDPGLDEVGDEDVALGEVFLVGLEGVQHRTERGRDLVDLSILSGSRSGLVSPTACGKQGTIWRVVAPWLLDLSAWTRADWLSFGQLFFTVLGFALAVGQIARTARASEDANQTLKNLRWRFLGNDLLILLPNLHRLEDELDEHVKSGRTREVERTLVAYSRQTAEAASLLKSEQDTADEPLIRLLAASGRAATKAKAEISQGTARSLPEVLMVVNEKMAQVSSETSGLLATLQRKVNTSANTE